MNWNLKDAVHAHNHPLKRRLGGLQSPLGVVEKRMKFVRQISLNLATFETNECKA
jgi:hypothetical protein